MATSRPGGDRDSTRDDVVDMVDETFDDADDEQLDLRWYDDDPNDADLPNDDLPNDADVDTASERFNAFDSSTWDIPPATVPWYETKQAMVTTVAATLAVVTLVVSVVLLAVRGSSATEDPRVDSPSTAKSSAPAATAVPATDNPPVVEPPPPPPPAPPIDPVVARPNTQQQDPRPSRTSAPEPTRVTVKATPPPVHPSQISAAPRPPRVIIRATPPPGQTP